MFYPKLRHAASSNSIIDISSIQHKKSACSNHFPSTQFLHLPVSKSSHNQNQFQTSYSSHHHLCHSYSNDSLDKEFIQNTKQTFNKLFLQTNFNGILDQIQCTLQPIVEQLRQQIYHKKYLSKQDRFLCMKSCAKFIIETLCNEQWDINENFTEFYHLKRVLDRFLLKQQTNISIQTNEQLETDMMNLHIENISKKTSKEKLKKILKASFPSIDKSEIPLIQSTNDIIRQKKYHKSVSHAFKKLNIDLQKLSHETPFKSHLSKYHKHNH